MSSSRLALAVCLLALLAGASAWHCTEPDWTCLTHRTFCYKGRQYKCNAGERCHVGGMAPCKPIASCARLPRYYCVDPTHFCNQKVMRCAPGTVCSNFAPEAINPCVHDYQAKSYCPEHYHYLGLGVCAKHV